MLLPDGSLRWCRSQGRVEFVGEKPVRMIGAIIDITKERTMLEQLRQSAERMRVAEEAAGFGVWDVDLATRTIRLSDGMRILNRLPEGADLEYPLDDYHKLADAEKFKTAKAAYAQAIATRQPFQFETECTLRDGSVRWHRIQGRPEFSPEGQPDGLSEPRWT